MSTVLELATAYVSLVPSMDGSRGAIERQLVPDAEQAGDRAGEAAGEGFSDKFKVAAAAAGAAAGAALTDGLMKNLEAQGANNKVSASMGLNEEEAARSGEAAGALWSSGYGEGLEDITTSVGDVMGSIEGMRDASAEDLADMTKRAQNFATAMDTDVATAAGTASLLISNGLAKDGVEAFDLLTAASQKVPSAMRADISAAAEEYGTFFSSLGFSGEEMFTALVDGSANGIIGIDKAGDAIKEFTIRATDGSASTGEALEGIGLNAGEMANAILAGGDSARGATQAIVDGLLGIEDPAAQSAAAIALFGTPLEDMNTAEIPAFLDSLSNMSGGLGDVEGASTNLDSTLNSGAASGLETLKRSFQGVFMDLTEDLLPAITAFTSWAVENPGVIEAVAYGVIALGAGLGIAAAAQWVMNSALLASPLTWVVVGIVALVAGLALLVANWDTVTAFLSTTWDSFVGWIGPSISGVGDWFVNLGSGIVDFFVEWGPRFLIAITGPIGWLVAWLVSNWDSVYSTATGMWQGLVDWLGGVGGWVLDKLSSLGQIPGAVVGYFAEAVSGATGKAGELVTFVGSIPGNILTALGNTGTLLKDAGTQIITGFFTGLKDKFEDVKAWVGGVGTWIADHKGPKAYDLELLQPAGGWIMTGLETGLVAGIPSLERTLGDVTDTIALGIPSNVNVGVSGASIMSGADQAPPGATNGRYWHVDNISTGADPEEIFEEADWRERTASLS